MGSEVRRAALALVAHREERFTTRRAATEARERVDRALEGMRFSRMQVEREWVDGAKGPELIVRLAPAPNLQRWLRTASLVLMALLAASVWAISSQAASRSVSFLLPMVTGFAILAMPIVGAAFGSQREGEEARLRKAIRTALADDDG